MTFGNFFLSFCKRQKWQIPSFLWSLWPPPRNNPKCVRRDHHEQEQERWYLCYISAWAVLVTCSNNIYLNTSMFEYMQPRDMGLGDWKANQIGLCWNLVEIILQPKLLVLANIIWYLHCMFFSAFYVNVIVSIFISPFLVHQIGSCVDYMFEKPLL